jgi:hypothetical protein
MDMTMIDITDIPNAHEADEVLLYRGSQLPISQISEMLSSIDYEDVCMLSKRGPRIHINAASKSGNAFGTPTCAAIGNNSAFTDQRGRQS